MTEKLTGIELIAAERERQITKEGWTPEHDATHAEGQLATAAACYALDYSGQMLGGAEEQRAASYFWPWDDEWWKPTPLDPVRQLTKAGALIAAEIDRIQRLRTRAEG